MDASPYRLCPELDADALTHRFARSGRARISGFLVEEDAERLYRHLRESTVWRLIVNQGDRVFELDRSAQAGLTNEGREALHQAVHKAARYGFQHLYEAIRVPDEEERRHADPTELNRFASFMSSPDVVSLLRRITGRGAIDFADAQATAYGLGHFLTAHDDDVAGKHRQAAYVFNLTPSWRPDWGGLLMFHGADGHIAEAYVPSFNALNIFSVPQTHSVSIVAPFAAARRYSVTGWLRSRAAAPGHGSASAGAGEA